MAETITLTIPDKEDPFWEKLRQRMRGKEKPNTDYVGHYRVDKDGKEIVEIYHFSVSEEANNIEKIAAYNGYRKQLAMKHNVDATAVHRDYLMSEEHFGRFCLERLFGNAGVKEEFDGEVKGLHFLVCDPAYTMSLVMG